MYYTFPELLLYTATHPKPIYSRHNLRDSSTQRSETWRKYCLPVQPCHASRFGQPTFRHLFQEHRAPEDDSFAGLAIVRGTILRWKSDRIRKSGNSFIVNNRSREKCVPPNYCFPTSDASVNFLTTLYDEYRDPSVFISVSRHVSAIEKSLLPNLLSNFFSLQYSYEKQSTPRPIIRL